MKRWCAVILSALLISAMSGRSNSDSSAQTQSSDSSEQPQSSIQPSVEESQTSKGITALYVTPNSCKINISEKRLLTVNSDSGPVLSSDLIWSSDDESIVTVDSSGNIIGKAPGDCVISVVYRDQPAINEKIIVTVKPKEESSTVQTSADQPSQASTADTSSQSSADNNGDRTTIIYVTPQAGNASPYNYSYYYGKDNFSYYDSSDGYVAYAMINTYLTSENVSWLSENDAQLLLNTIYAKYGYHFSTSHIRQFFNSQSWYSDLGRDMEETKSAINKYGTDTDKHNFDLLVKLR